VRGQLEVQRRRAFARLDLSAEPCIERCNPCRLRGEKNVNLITCDVDDDVEVAAGVLGIRSPPSIQTGWSVRHRRHPLVASLGSLDSTREPFSHASGNPSPSVSTGACSRSRLRWCETPLAPKAESFGKSPRRFFRATETECMPFARPLIAIGVAIGVSALKAPHRDSICNVSSHCRFAMRPCRGNPFPLIWVPTRVRVAPVALVVPTALR
jgi:hypothetical protein